MSRKTRKLIWSVPLVAVFAVVGALAAFVALTPNGTQAHDLEVPGAVSNLKPEADGNKAVDLSWTAPSTGGMVTGYRIDASGDGQTWMSIMADTGNMDTSYRDDMIVDFLGDDRFYRVFAMNQAGTGPVSQTAGPVSVPAAGAPGDVTGISATAMGREAIKLMWSEPSSTGGTDSITKYVIAGAQMEASIPAVTGLPSPDDMDPSESSADANDGTVAFATSDAATSYTLEGLDAGDTWFFRVYAYNGEEVSAGAAETRSATTDSLGKIGPATGLRAISDPVASAVNLYWYWPADDGGRAITHWKIERRQTALADGQTGITLNEWRGIADDDSAHSITAAQSFDYQDADVLVGAKYQYRVTARTGDEANSNEGTTSGTSNAATANPVLECPVTRDDADNPTAVELADEATCALNNARVTDANVAAERDGKGNVEVKITRENPRKATSFRIDVSPDGNKWMPVNNYVGNLGSGDDFVYEYLDETTGGDRYYRVFAYVGSSQLLPSNPGPEEAGIKKVMAPGKVESLKATAISQTQIDVTWSAPMKDGDAVVDMYCVQISDDDGASFDALGDDTAHSDAAGTLTDTGDNADTAMSLCARHGTNAGEADTFVLTDEMSYSHKKLMAGQTRFYKVYAINNPVVGGDGRSVTSDTVSAKTMKQDKPMMPTGLTAETAKDSNYGGRVNSGVYLLWNAPPKPAGGMVESYVVQRKVDDGSWADLESDTENMRTIYHDQSEPAEDEMRAYRVAAKNSSGTSDWSNMAYYPAGMPTHMHVAPTGTITVETLTVGDMETVDAAMYFTDAMSYTVMSSMPMYATAMVDDMGMVTINAVAAGASDITVTATGMFGTTATQMFTVTVEAASTALGPPAITDVTVDDDDPGMPNIDVTWDNGANALSHMVMLLSTPDYDLAKPIATSQDDGMTTFTDVAAGTYVVVVVSYDASFDFQFVFTTVTVAAGN